MTLTRAASGIYECDFRRVDMARLHLSLKTRNKAVAQRRHDAVEKVVRQKRLDMLNQLRVGIMTVERLEHMVEHHEPLAPVTREGILQRQRAASKTVDQTIAEYVGWMKAHPKKRARTTVNAGFQLKRFAMYVLPDGRRLGDLPLDAVTNAMVRGYQQAFIDAKTSPNSITVYVSRVGALWRFAQKQEARDAQEQQRPARVIYSPVDPETTYAERRQTDRTLSADEVTLLLAASPDQMIFPVACSLFAGLRMGEVTHLRRGIDVDLELGTLAVRVQEHWRPKTKRSIRVVPIAAALRPILERHLERFASETWVMPGPLTPDEPIKDLTFRQRFIPIVERAGLTYGREKSGGVTFHTLRHTFASHAVMRGVDLYTVAQLLGDSLKMVEDTYAHLSPDFKRAAIAKLEGAFVLPPELTLEMTQKERQ